MDVTHNTRLFFYDFRSAALLQKIVKRNFEQCTVITIARRLKTVIDADRIMVMDNGKIKELDPPHMLLQNEKGIFYSLVRQVIPFSFDQQIP